MILIAYKETPQLTVPHPYHMRKEKWQHDLQSKLPYQQTRIFMRVLQ